MLPSFALSLLLCSSAVRVFKLERKDFPLSFLFLVIFLDILEGFAVAFSKEEL